MQNNLQELWLGDCLELMKKIPDKSIDLVLTDPPYNIARKNNFNTMGSNGIDFGEWDKDADIFSYIKECYRVLKGGGSFITFSDWKKLGDVSKFSEFCGFITKDMIRLKKTNPMPRNRDRRYITDFECGIWFVMPNNKWTFNRQDVSYQRPEFACSIDRQGYHPTQKPLKLMEELIKIHSNIGDIILDCFAGSGTTCLAAKNLNRQFIGIEKEEKYYNIAKNRVENAK